MSASGLLAELGGVVVCVIAAKVKCLLCILKRVAIIPLVFVVHVGILVVQVSEIGVC